MNEEVPDGWSCYRLEEIFSVQSGGTPSRKVAAYFQSGTIPWVKTGDFANSDIEQVEEHITERALSESSAKVFPEGTILVAMYGEGKTRGQIGRLTFPAATNQACAALINTTLSPEFNQYVFYYLLGQYHALRAQSVGGNQPNLSLGTIKGWNINIPPAAEQRRIVAKVEALLSTVRLSQERLDKIPTILKRFRQAILAAACTGKLTADWRENSQVAERGEGTSVGQPPEDIELPKSWGWVHSSNVFAFVTSGSRGWAKHYSDEGALFIRVGNLDHDTIELDLSEVQKVSPPAGAEGLRTSVMKGDILISITADVGMVAVVDRDIGEAYINQHVALARPNGRLNQRYLAYFLASQSGQQQFFSLQRGATKVGLGLDDIRGVWIAQPPKAEQDEIVGRIEAMLALANRIEARYEKAKAHTEKLTRSVLAKAFRGELVPTEADLARREGRPYETAEQLLARINATRTSTNNTSKKALRTGQTRTRKSTQAR